MSGKPTILVVDDEFLVAMALADELEDRGFEVVGPFAEADDAMAAVKTATPDAALLDVNLGKGRTSYDLAVHLLEAGTPVTFLTGYSEFKPKDSRVAAAAFLGKPVDPERAVKEVNRMLGTGN